MFLCACTYRNRIDLYSICALVGAILGLLLLRNFMFLCACTYRNRIDLYSICALVDAILGLLSPRVRAVPLITDTYIVAVRNRRDSYA